MGRMVRFPTDDGEVLAYLARAASGFGAGVVVVDAGWREADITHALCDGLAGCGFTALAPDLHDGRGEPLSEAAAVRAVREAVDYLSFHPSVRDAGVAGVASIGDAMPFEGLGVPTVSGAGGVEEVVARLLAL